MEVGIDDGEVKRGEGEVERSCYCIHAPIHKALPQAKAVFHTHMPHASALTRIADAGGPNVEATRKHGSAILEQVNALQQSNRRVLEKLRPVGLMELGLREALGALLRLWGESHPDVAVETAISQSLGDTGETADLTIYRTIQEALTNVFRHAGATRVNVNVEPAELSSGLTRAGRGGALVRVRDNGSGLRPDHKLGLGLTGMRERILALGGSLTIASGDGGVTVEAVVPRDAGADPGILPGPFGTF
jgi:two-component system sensor histidine kinase UhpB